VREAAETYSAAVNRLTEKAVTKRSSLYNTITLDCSVTLSNLFERDGPLPRMQSHRIA